MDDLPQLRAWLADAELACHKLMTGSLRQRVVSGNSDVTYAQADMGKLESYIASLKSQIAALDTNSSRGASRPIHFTF